MAKLVKLGANWSNLNYRQVQQELATIHQQYVDKIQRQSEQQK